jgi:hypothetical protein
MYEVDLYVPGRFCKNIDHKNEYFKEGLHSITFVSLLTED